MIYHKPNALLQKMIRENVRLAQKFEAFVRSGARARCWEDALQVERRLCISLGDLVFFLRQNGLEVESEMMSIDHMYAFSIYYKSIKMSLEDTKLFNDYPVKLIKFHWFPLFVHQPHVVQGESLMHQSPPYYHYCSVLTSFASYIRHLIQYSLTDCLWHNQIDIKHGK